MGQTRSDDDEGDAVTTQRHRIRRQVLEVTIRNREKAWEIQSTLGRLQQARIESMLDRCLSAASPPDRVVRIDKLVVDLGHVRLDQLDGLFLEQLEIGLSKAIAERIREADQAVAEQGEDAEVAAQLELLVTFVQTGTLPWWADTSRPGIVRESVAMLLQRDSDRLGAIVRSIGRDPRALMRLIEQTDGDRRFALVEATMPAHEGLARLTELHTFVMAYQMMFGGAAASKQTAMWVGLLGEVCRGVDVVIAVNFWRDVLARVAAEIGLSYASFVGEIHRIVVGVREFRLEGFVAVLERLKWEWEAGANASSHSFASGVRERTSDGATVLEDAPVPGFGPESGALSDQQAPCDDAQTQSRLRGTPVSSPLTTSNLVDELYVDNAGLVALWPFVGTFLERIGLVKENLFDVGSARHRAVGLLHWLASGDIDPPEYLLVLPKVLCGLAVDDVFHWDEPVTEAEAAVGTAFLSEVIAQAPILGDMSIDGFRGSFLLRKGVLSTRDGMWLLRVERVAYDVVLDRFPWRMVMVRLPWMAAPMVVEW